MLHQDSSGVNSTRHIIELLEFPAPRNLLTVSSGSNTFVGIATNEIPCEGFPANVRSLIDDGVSIESLIAVVFTIFPYDPDSDDDTLKNRLASAEFPAVSSAWTLTVSNDPVFSGTVHAKVPTAGRLPAICVEVAPR